MSPHVFSHSALFTTCSGFHCFSEKQARLMTRTETSKYGKNSSTSTTEASTILLFFRYTQPVIHAREELGVLLEIEQIQPLPPM